MLRPRREELPPSSRHTSEAKGGSQFICALATSPISTDSTVPPEAVTPLEFVAPWIGEGKPRRRIEIIDDDDIIRGPAR